MNRATLVLCGILCNTPAFAEPSSSTDVSERRVFALVSAMGNRFSAVHEVVRTGSNLAPYRHRSFEVKDDAINRIMLKSLGDAVAAIDGRASRVYLSVRLPQAVLDRPSSLEERAMEFAREQLRRMPQRGEWHRIVVATPAYRNGARDGIGGNMGGLGLFTEPLCQGDIRFCDTRSRPATAGIQAQTPSGEAAAASRYVAPFLFAKIWILDAATLAVLDSQEVFDHHKLFDPDSGAMDMNASIDHKLLATHIVDQVEASAREAVGRSELRGRVEVRERGQATSPQ